MTVRTLATLCRCGLPIEAGDTLPYRHTVNPGRNHHYVRPAFSRSGPQPTAGSVSPHGAGSGRAAVLTARDNAAIPASPLRGK